MIWFRFSGRRLVLSVALLCLHARIGSGQVLPDSAARLRALLARSAARDSSEQGTLRYQLGAVYRLLGQPDSALRYLQQSLRFSQGLSEGSNQSAILDQIGLTHSGLGNSDSALAYYRRALGLRTRNDDRAGEGEVLLHIGGVHDNLGQFDSALVYYHQALDLQRGAGDRRGEGSTLHNMGNSEYRLGRPDSALSFWRRALVLRRESGDRGGEGKTLTGIGAGYLFLGNRDSALVYFQHALAIAVSLGDRALEGSLRNNLGALYSNVGRLDSALSYWSEALRIRQGIGDRLGEGGTLQNLGVLQIDLGRPDSALNYYRRALKLARIIGDRQGEGELLHNIAMGHNHLGRVDSALVAYGQALAVARALGDRAGEALTLSNMGSAYLDLRRSSAAHGALRRALTLAREVGDRGLEGEVLDNLGSVYQVQGRPDSALRYFREGLAIAREVQNGRREAAALSDLASTYAGLGAARLPTAVAYFDSAAQVRRGLAAHAGSEANRVSYAEQQTDLYANWSLAWLARAPEVGSTPSAIAALAAVERGRSQALLELMRQADSLPAPRPLPAEGADLLASVSRNGIAVLSYLLTGDTLVCWFAVPGREIEVTRRLVPIDSLRYWVGGLRGAVEGTRERRGLSFAAAAGRLSDLLLPAGLNTLPPDQEIVVIPHGVVALVPFSALPLGPGQPLLGTRYAIRYDPSLAVLVAAESRPSRMRAPEASRDALIVGNPQMPSRSALGESFDLAGLPGAEVEAVTIAAQLGTKAVIGSEASEAIVRRRLPTAALVHLATHGYAYSSEARVRQSFVALAPSPGEDGFLTVGELLDDPALTLTAELVVLSACETGLGNLRRAEGTVGLQRALLARGARSILVSLWSVSDAATRALMTAFYRHWLQDQDSPSKAEALRRSQEEVRRTPGFEHPRYWAAFQLVGAR